MAPPVKTVVEPRALRGDLSELPAAPLLRPFASSQGVLYSNDVDQGKIKNCCLPAVLAAMANTSLGQERIRKMIAFNEQVQARSVVNGAVVVTPGIVRVTFGVGASVIAISRLLYREKSPNPPGEILYAKSLSGQGWVSFIEKAYAVFASHRAKQGEVGYASLVLIDPKTVMLDLLAPRLAPLVIPVTKYSAPAAVSRWLARSGQRPTIATTPKAADNGFNTPHALMANHAYAVVGLDITGQKRARESIVKLSSDEAEIALGDFIADFDSIVTLRD